MDKLASLYSRYNNFSTYRNEKLNAIEEDNDELKIEIKKLEFELKKIQLEYEMKIHELKSQVNTTKAKNRLNEELNEEKAELKRELHFEIVKYFENGMSAREIANHLGLNSTTLIYQAINSNEVDAVAPENVAIEWQYFDNAAIHMYAVSGDRKYIKVHSANGKHKVITADDFRYVSGDHDVSVNSKRVKIALEMFDGTYKEKYIERPNPYSQSE